MGVFYPSDDEDGRLINSILNGFQNFWNQDEGPRSSIHIEANTHNVSRIQDYANEAFASYYKNPSYFQRIAAFLVLTTVCPCFSVRAEGKLVTDKQRRKWFFARANLLILPALFEILSEQNSDAPKWPGLPTKNILQQIVAFVELIDVSDVVSEKNQHTIKGLAKDIAALSLIIQVWVESNPSTGTHSMSELLDNTGLLS